MSYPSSRMRRMRAAEFSRRLMRETVLSPDDLIWPVFVVEGENTREPVLSMPGVDRLSTDLLLAQAERCLQLGVPAICLFPVTPENCKSDDAQEAWNPEGLAQRTIRALKRHVPRPGDPHWPTRRPQHRGSSRHS